MASTSAPTSENRITVQVDSDETGEYETVADNVLITPNTWQVFPFGNDWHIWDVEVTFSKLEAEYAYLYEVQLGYLNPGGEFEEMVKPYTPKGKKIKLAPTSAP